MNRVLKLKETMKVCKIIITECSVKLPMSKMSYPEAIITNQFGYPKYNETIKQSGETYLNAKKIIEAERRKNGKN